MKRQNFISAVFRLWISTIAILFMSCTKEELTGMHVPSDHIDAPAYLTLTVAHPDAVLVKTRADDKGPYEIPYTNAESSIRNLMFFIFDVDSQGRESIDPKQMFEVVSPVFATGVYTMQRTVSLKPGVKHVYVAANLTTQQRNLIYESCRNNGNFKMDDIILAGNTHDEALANVIKDDWSHSGQGTDILMFAQAFTGDSSDPECNVEITGDQDSYHLAAQLKRLVTKVLVTCREETAGFVDSGDKFIIPTEDVRYCLNTTSKQIYLKERFNEISGINETPDWLLQEYSTKTGDDSYKQHYLYISGGDLLNRIQDQRYSSIPEVYDENRFTVNENTYVSGLYCLENTTSAGDVAWADIDATAKYATTHIVLRARMIPRRILADDLSGDIQLTGYPEQHEGGNGLSYWKESLPAGRDSRDGMKPYPEGTYWTLTENGETTYYRIQGRNSMIDSGRASISDFVKYEGGYNWFYTFIEGGTGDRNDGNTLSYVGDSYWGISRNEYYIVNINSISHIGEANPGGDYIRINSETIPWFDRGSCEVVIKPKRIISI